MKKLSLLLLTVLISGMGWAAIDPNTGWPHLNPYVYDMTASVDGSNLKLTYKLNARSFGNESDYEKLNGRRGIQIYLLYKDAQGEWQRITDLNTGYAGVSDDGSKIVSGGYQDATTYNVSIPLGAIPEKYKDMDLLWEAEVHGNKGRTKPQIIKGAPTDNSNRPTNAYGIAFNNDPTHKRFAQIFVSEACPSKRTGWNWAKDFEKGKYWTNTSNYENSNTMLEYNPWLKLVCPHHKKMHNGNYASYFYRGDLGNYANASRNYEPNRVKISEDGRLFTSSFHPKSLCAVYEYKSSYDYWNVIDYDWTKEVQGNNDGNNPLLYKRVIGMDVKGSGDNLKILLCWIDANGIYKDNKYEAKIELWEYELGRAESAGYIPNAKKYLPAFNEACGYVHKIAEVACDNSTNLSEGGALYQGFRLTNKTSFYYNAVRGFVDVAYGNNDDAWVKVDYGWGDNYPACVFRISLKKNSESGYFDPQRTTLEQNSHENGSGFYGGSGLFVRNNILFTGTGLGVIRAYIINSDGTLGSEKTEWRLTDNTANNTRIGHWITGFAEDYAKNLYVLTEGYYTTNSEDFTANIVAIAMPYEGSITTRAKNTFTLSSSPMPNILATDLRYQPDGNTDGYVFSFKVNTKPKLAQLRFYDSYEKMKASIKVVHADNFDGNNDNKPSFVYNIPPELLKQGKISVSLDMCGGELSSAIGSEGAEIINNALPPGEWYWSVYVEAPRRSYTTAPIYQQNVDFNHSNKMRKQIAVNNYPETDMFGAIIAANYRTDRQENKGIEIYGIQDKGIDDNNASTSLKNERYERDCQYANYTFEQNGNEITFNNPRHPAIHPNGIVYFADEGNSGLGDGFHNKKDTWYYSNGGIKIWDPKLPNQIQKFSDNKINTSTGIDLWQEDPNDDASWKLYATNTYPEFTIHSEVNGAGYYTRANAEDRNYFGWNGFVEYVLDKYTGNSSWTDYWKQNQRATEFDLGEGDASGYISLAAMDQGLWLCQHREHSVAVKDKMNQPLADNPQNVCISFVPYKSHNRTWKSSWHNGDKNNSTQLANRSKFSQTTDAPVQSTPGGGIAYKKTITDRNDYSTCREYIYVPNHDGNIAEIQITGWLDKGKNTAKPILDTTNVRIIETPEDVKADREVQPGIRWKAAAITSMDFDYAGNLFITIGPRHGNDSHALMAYTMPYNRVNAQEIQAPNSCRYIPERISQTYDKHGEIITPYLPNSQGGVNKGTCGLDIFRPMLSGSFNTICLPFDLASLEGTPYEGATVMKYTGASYRMQNGEGMVDLNFQEIAWGTESMQAGEPHLIQLGKDNQGKDKKITGIVRFKEIQFETTQPEDKDLVKVEVPNGITLSTEPKAMYQGIFDKKSDWDDEDLPALILVDQNRLAEVFSSGTMQGFRGYFRVTDMPSGTTYSISSRKPIATGLVDHKGRPINIDKYLREGRVYIRVGDSLYTLTGEKVE